jgi:basic membrane protein A
MKRFLALTLAVLMAVSMICLTSCSKTDDSKADETVADATGSTTENKDIKVGAIYINSQNDTAGYTYAHHKGITSAMEQLGISTDNLYIVDNVAEDDTEVSNAIDTLAGKGCDIIFGISFGYINAMNEAASKEEYSDIIFSHATGYLSNDTNFNNYFGRIYQARYLAGVAAGLKTLELGNNKVGYVAAWGTEYAETCSGINAFTLGVQSVNPDAKVYVNQISTWGDESKERQAAEALVDTYNCCVIAQHCDSAQPQLVAAEKGVYGCGYNSDMTVQAPTAHLTAPVWNWDVYYKLAIETAMNEPDQFMEKIGNYYGGLAEGFVDISEISDNCAEGTSELCEAVKALIVSGEWDVFSGVKLSYTENEDGSWSITKTDSALVTNDGETIVEAGGASIDDSVIKGSMNYYVEGVIAG